MSKRESTTSEQRPPRERVPGKDPGREPRRIAVLGSPGAGKSTLARRLGTLTGLPVYHLDRLFWRPGWQDTPKEEWIALQTELVERPSWIIDGHYGETLGLRLNACDAVVALDFPRVVCLVRALRRIIASYGRVRPDMGPGSPERFDTEFLRYIWAFPRRQRRSMLEALDGARRSGKPVLLFRSPRALEAWLRGANDNAGALTWHLSSRRGRLEASD
jgi:adenylate kinase family enzyme